MRLTPGLSATLLFITTSVFTSRWITERRRRCILWDKIEEKHPKGKKLWNAGKFSRLNAIRAMIAGRHDSDYDRFCELSTYSHYPQRERKKEAKKERET